MPESVSAPPKPLALRVVTWAVVIVLLILIVLGGLWLRANWALLHPTDSASAWAAIGAMGGVVAAASAVAVAVFAYRGLASLRIARDEIKHRAVTDAKLCAIRRLEEVARDIVPLNTEALTGLAADGLGVFLSPHQSVTFDPDPQDLKAAREWYDALSPTTHNTIIGVLNRLEAWSVYFTSGVADPEIARGPVGPVLRSWVGQYYAVLLILRSDRANTSGKFPNLVRLYTAWSARMDADQLQRIHQDISGQMDRAKARIRQVELPTVVPNIGL